jgi:branched-subunit amino acid transport protein
VLIAAILALAAGTYGFRLAGVLLRDRLQLPAPVRRLLPLAAAALLAALGATAALTANQAFAGWARPAGVAVGALLAWRRAPFAVIVVGAAATTALLRLFGVP